MPRRSIGEYPENWKDIAKQTKDQAKWRCIRCRHPHDPDNGYCLTVHHIDLNKTNCEWWNLAALCQRCHLQIQHKVIIEQPYMFEHSDWFKPYVAGYYAFIKGLPHDRGYIDDNMESLL
jgi:5-methylcytosine-specific restriction endonuclease McrA